jgi:putative transposase
MEGYLLPYVDVYAYCLMINHFHLLIKIKDHIPRTNMVLAFKYFFMSYAKAINKQENRTGGLFQQKFKRKEVSGSHYFSQVILYIHMNPVMAGLCGEAQDFTYSSFNTIISDAFTNIKRCEVLDWFGGVAEFLRIHKERAIDIQNVKNFSLG